MTYIETIDWLKEQTRETPYEVRRNPRFAGEYALYGRDIPSLRIPLSDDPIRDLILAYLKYIERRFDNASTALRDSVTCCGDPSSFIGAMTDILLTTPSFYYAIIAPYIRLKRSDERPYVDEW